MEIQHTLANLDSIIGMVDMPPIKVALQAVAHKLRFPMKDILEKVPGDTLSARARAIGVSRQTMYVWAEERFRPTLAQARIISELSDVPVEQIVDDGFVEGWSDAGKKVAKKVAKVARRSAKAKAHPKRGSGATRRRMVAKPKRARKTGKLHKRAGR